MIKIKTAVGPRNKRVMELAARDCGSNWGKGPGIRAAVGGYGRTQDLKGFRQQLEGDTMFGVAVGAEDITRILAALGVENGGI